MRVRVGVVGAGLMGGHHARNLGILPEVELAGVADPDLARAHALADALGVPALDHADALLGRVDAVVVATPADQHAAVAARLLEAGVHVLVEKPITTRLEDARELFRIAEARGRVLQVGHLLRYHRGVQALIALALQPEGIEARRVVPGARDAGISVLMDLMVHDLDLVLRLVGAPPARAEVRGLGAEGSEDEVEVSLTFASGAAARLLASRAREAPERLLRIEGERGRASLDFFEPATLRHQRGSEPAARVEFPGENPLRAQLVDFVARVRGGRGAPAPEAELALIELALFLQDRLAAARQPVTAPPGRSPIM